MVDERVVHARLIPHRKLSVPTQFVFFSSLNQLASSVWQFVETRLLLLMDSFVWRLTTRVSQTRLDTGPEISFCEIYQEGTNRKQKKTCTKKTRTIKNLHFAIGGSFYQRTFLSEYTGIYQQTKNIHIPYIVTFFPKDFASELPGTPVILEDSKGFNQSLLMKIHHPSSLAPSLHRFHKGVPNNRLTGACFEPLQSRGFNKKQVDFFMQLRWRNLDLLVWWLEKAKKTLLKWWFNGD